MKTLNSILIAAALTGTIGLTGSASAQLNANHQDGIAASPKVRQMLDERSASSNPGSNRALTAPVMGGSRNAGLGQIIASPKAAQMLGERSAAPAAPVTVMAAAPAGYKAEGADGIAASPKLREQLNEHEQAFTVAPVK